ncbi:RNA-directed DNA polymerase (Reverse transcriptase), partial [Trifolium medium]|nr:RNA-directed DNA polymerase (Reverse transcriptase) [Trifolium medium]
GRQILDGIMITNEVVDEAKTSASVLVNCSPSEEFYFDKGSRQGDPLSPFLFLIATEGLNAMMNMLQCRLCCL